VKDPEHPTMVTSGGVTASVVLFARKPRPDATSIEHVFDVVVPRLGPHLDVTVLTSPYDNQGLVPRLRSVLWARAHRGDVNHVLGDTNFFAIGLDRERTVLTVHDCEFLERANAVKRSIYEWLWLRIPVGRATIVTVPSIATRDELVSYVGTDHDVRVIYNPVDDIFTVSERAFDEARPVILQVGARSNKNLERTARALQGVPCTLVVVGTMSGEQRALLTSLGLDFVATGPLTTAAIAERYRTCDVVVFASTKEGFGLPIVEAQASGRPVVTSDLPPMSEVAGDGACLVDPFDVASIRAGITRVLSDAVYRRDLVRAGLRNVERFHPDAIAKQYEAVYDEILSR
jgi:glycosyltransferase involved in cell wall biosynthesis